MTMVDLFRRFGYDTPREVAPDGGLRFIEASKSGVSAGSYPMPKHTFHGGEERADADEVEGKAWWLDESVTERDRAAMARAFPSFIEIPSSEANPASWVGEFNTGSARFTIAMVHRRDHGLPLVVPVTPEKRGRFVHGVMVDPPHYFVNTGRLCIASDEDWDPELNTIADVVAWTAHWHACYVEWVKFGKWPTEGYLNAAAA